MNKKAFTLIELLVVVLIIGILAAVAVPQYQKAILKTRFAQLLIINDSIVKAENLYFLANGEYTQDLSILDITLPAIPSIQYDISGTSPSLHTSVYLRNNGKNIVTLQEYLGTGHKDCCYYKGDYQKLGQEFCMQTMGTSNLRGQCGSGDSWFCKCYGNW